MKELNLNRSNVTLACVWCLKELKCESFEQKTFNHTILGFWNVGGEREVFGENLTVGNEGGFLTFELYIGRF